MKLFFSAVLLWAPIASAWNVHQDMVNRMVLENDPSSRGYLNAKVSVPCMEEERRELERLAEKIQVSGAAIPLVSKKKCGSGKPEQIPLLELLKLGFIDEPDHGMDQDLPESSDPNGFRRWMGGVSGPTSQGFRHMVFPGIDWGSPLRTLQIPVSRVGEAPARIELLSNVSKEYLKKGDLFFGVRVLLWREHFIEDLLQPFHTTQVPSLKMLPWRDLLSGFVSRSTQTIANYHYAYEGLAGEMVKLPGERGVQDCFISANARVYPGESTHLLFGRSRASRVGESLYAIFGDYPKSKSVDLPEGIGQLDYYQLVNARSESLDAEEMKELDTADRKELQRTERLLAGLDRLRELTCELMRESTSLFWGNLDEALQESSSSIKTGK